MLLALLVAPLLALLSPAKSLARPFEPGQVVVRVRAAGPLHAMPDGTTASDRPEIARLLTGLGLTNARDLLVGHGSLSAGRDGYLLLSSARADFDPVAAARTLVQSGAALAACPNLHLHYAVTVPNDPLLSDQWALSVSSAAIRIRNAWDISKGDTNVVIAILDSGVDTGHPDLASKIWHNRQEIPGNGIDDDHNGLVDDTVGWDFGDNDNDPRPTLTVPDDVGFDVGFHGTFTAGIAAAATNNGEGIAGVAWNCRIMPLKIQDTAGDILVSAVVSAFDYAVAKRVAVINMSFGGSDESLPGIFQPLINEAYNAGIVCVAAAGNDGTDIPVYPAACDSVLAVAATNESNARSDFSNWGYWVDIAAPGEGIASTIPTNYEYDDVTQLIFELLYGWDGVTPYMLNDGTSFAAPIVSGVAALVKSRFPSFTPRQVMEQLVLTGDVVAYDNPIGPRLNALHALTPAVDVPNEAAPLAAGTIVRPNPFRSTATVRFSTRSAGPVDIEVFDVDGRRVRATRFDAPAAGEHELTLDRRGNSGVRLHSGLYFVRVRASGGDATRRITVLD